MLLSDEQRDNACAPPRDQYGAGRMTLEDYSARIDKVLAARDTNQVSLAFKGLEGHKRSADHRHIRPGDSRGRPGLVGSA